MRHQTYVKSTMIHATRREKRTKVQASIYAQTGQLKPNLRRNESSAATDIDNLLDSRPTIQKGNTLF